MSTVTMHISAKTPTFAMWLGRPLEIAHWKIAKLINHGHRSSAGVISSAIRWHFRFQFSQRGIEDLMSDRGLGEL